MRVSRSSGAGGQHVNKTSSRVELVWRPEASAAGSSEQRDRIVAKLAARISADGGLSVVASETRSQLRNRELAESKLAGLVAAALTVPKKRRPTKPTRAAREERLTVKKLQSKKKRERRDRNFE